MLTEVDENVQFTIEEEKTGCLPFLDIMLHKELQTVKFSIYNKNTNRDDFIHYVMRHNKRTKTGVVISLSLRAITISSSEYKIKCIKEVLKNFKEECDNNGRKQKRPTE